MNKLFLWAAAALCFAACSDDDLATVYNNDANAVHFSVEANELESGTLAKSNIFGYDEKEIFEAGDRIAISMGGQAASTYVRKADGSWLPETDDYLVWVGAQNLKVEAFYPADKHDASMTSFTVPERYDSDEDLANADYMTCSMETGKVAKVKLQMERKMSLIIVNVEEMTGQFASGYTVDSLWINVNTMGYVDGAVKFGDRTIKPFRKVNEVDGSYDYYAMIAPTKERWGSTTNRVFITLALRNTADNTTCHYSFPGIPVLDAGNYYICTLSVGQTEPVVDNGWRVIVSRVGGYLTEDMVTNAMSGGRELTLSGPINAADWNVLKSYGEDYTPTVLDLSDMIYDGDARAFNLNSERFEELNDIILPNNLTVIPNDFMTSDDLVFLHKVTFPGNITHIGSNALVATGYDIDDKGVMAINMLGLTQVPTLGENAFGDAEILSNNTYHRLLYVSGAEMAEKLKNDPAWSQYLYDAETRPGGIEIVY